MKICGYELMLEISCASYAAVCLCIHINSCFDALLYLGAEIVTKVVKTAFIMIFA